MKYCTRCIYPETKPDLWFNNDGICSACINYEKRPAVDWFIREKEFDEIISKYRSINKDNYDCIIPVSGGKDSTYQTLKLLEKGINPLCVTAATDSLSELGRRNIENLKHLGVDHIELTPNPLTRRKIAKFALETVGDIQWAEHVTIFTAPIRVAVEKKIKLIIWGENSQHEYGGPAAASENHVLDRSWLEEFGGMLGMRVADLKHHAAICDHQLLPYTYPSSDVLQESGVTGLFLGYYFPWDGYNNALYAQANGFETYPIAVEGNFVNYENLDNYYHGIHDYFKYLKFGFSRATDQANNHIRRGRISREAALKCITKLERSFPRAYLGRDLVDILAEIDLPLEKFIEICDKFTNRKIFKCKPNGELIKNDDHSPILKERY